MSKFKKTSLGKKSETKAILHMETFTTVNGKLTSRTAITYGVCQTCGCTDFDCAGCIKKTGQPCSWVDRKHTLCTACVPQAPKVRHGLRISRGGA